MGVGQFAEFGEGALKDFINLDRELQRSVVELSDGHCKEQAFYSFPFVGSLRFGGKFFGVLKKNIALCWCAVGIASRCVEFMNCVVSLR